MKTRLLFAFGMLLAYSLGAQKSWEYLPPFNFRVDSVSLLATWEAPKIVVLNEDFEGDDFPPAGWADTSLGVGWQCEENPQYHAWWIVPEHTGKIALVNDDWIPNNNGSLDYLFTPELNLTVADSFMLQFDSYFDGAYGQTAYVEYSPDNGETWALLEQMEPSLYWQKIKIDLSEFSGLEGLSNFKLAFYTNDRPDNLGWWGSGWAVDNVLVFSDENPHQVHHYKIFLDSNLIYTTYSRFYQYSFNYLTTHTCAVMAHYHCCWDSYPAEQVVHAAGLPQPDSLSGFAPDNVAILTWAPPWVLYDGPAAYENRDVGDPVRFFDAPDPIISCYGICDDGEGLWITDPNRSANTIFRVTYEGVNTGETINLYQGQSWIGDMVSDGTYLYCCFIGGSNRIGKVYLPTGQIIGTIGGDFSAEAQMGLAADFENEEFYIGGWNSNMIWRTHFNGLTISTHPFDNVSGLAWSPNGGPFNEGSLWVMVKNAPNAYSWVSEIDPNINWVKYQSFAIPGGGTNSGAGIEMKFNGYYGMEALWICNLVQNKIYLSEVIEFWIHIPPSGVPENLIGFNVYRNDDFRGYVGYTAPDSCAFLDPISWSEWNEGAVLEYEVTAVYDMSPYGFPADTGESLPEGPAEINLGIYWLELDFLEDWSAGTFNDNAWYISDSNWIVSEELGNGAPCAVFNPDTAMSEYTSDLQSFHFMDLSADDIILEYDVSLSAVVPTGNEHLLVQVYDYTNKAWNTVRTLTNSEGSFDWITDSLNIAGAYNEGAFRVRFRASGENTANINYWAVDNISLTRICPAPDSIEAIIIPSSEDSVLVTWEEPTPPISEWKQWDDGIHFNSIGFGTGKESSFDIAIRWTPELLAGLKGSRITSVGFIPGDVSACFKIAMWSGDDIEPFYTQAAGNLTACQYNLFQLDAPQIIDITKDLYIGYRLSTYCDYPISVDDGPASDSLGNMFRFGSGGPWTTLLALNPDFTWNLNIKAYFERDGVQYESYYNVFRSIDGSDPEMLAETMESEFTDPAGTGTGLYCYSVKALFYNGCVSDFSPEACVLFTEIPAIDEEDYVSVSIYPNPARDVLNIESSEEIQSVTIFDSHGITIEQWNNGTMDQANERSGDQAIGHFVELPVNGLPPGLYLVRVVTKGGVVTRKVLIVK